jgi:beta-lactamase regulating signal transducer with metallopeptidase domain
VTLCDHLWQSTLVAVFVWFLTLLFRKNRASIRYGLWLAASLKFLLPFSLLAMLGRTAFVHEVPAGSIAVLARIRPVAMPFSAVAQAPDHLPWLRLLAVIWMLGMIGIVAVWLVQWVRLSAIARGGEALTFDLSIPVRSTPILLEPGLVGIWRPVIILPDGIVSHLSAMEIDAILSHELCHLRRRDNLLACVHMLVEAVFWFHPLVWFIGARLVEEREKACDESVLAGGQNPLEYAQAILKVCRLYLRSPLACSSGVSGADLGRRVDAIMAGRDIVEMDPARKLLLAGLLLATLAAPLVTGGLHVAPPAQLMQSLATSLLPRAPTKNVAGPVAIIRPVANNDARPRQRNAAWEASIESPVRVLREPAIPDSPPVIIIASPQLQPVEQQVVDETNVCRPPQQQSGSRLMGPRVCLPQYQWDRIKERNLVLMPDGVTLATNYEKESARMARVCAAPSYTSILANVSSAKCF